VSALCGIYCLIGLWSASDSLAHWHSGSECTPELVVCGVVSLDGWVRSVVVGVNGILGEENEREDVVDVEARVYLKV